MTLSPIIVCLTIIAIVLFFSAELQEGYGLSNKLGLPSNWSTLKLLINDKISLFISLPEDWKIEKESLYDNVADAITIVPPKNMPSFIPTSKLIVGIEKLGSGTSMSEYTKSAIVDLSSELNNFELIDSFPINISASSGERIIFTHKVNDHTIKVLQTWLINNEIAYIITFATTPESFGYYNPILNKIISSVTIAYKEIDDKSVKPLERTLGYKLFESPFGFELSYPDDWILSEGENRLSIISNQSEMSDRYLERLDIYYNVSSSDNLVPNSSQTQDEKMRIEVLNEIKYLVNNLQNLDIISIKNVNVSNSIMGKELLYNYDSNIGKTKVKEYLFDGNSISVILTFSTSIVDFDDMSNTIEKILNSFKFEGN